MLIWEGRRATLPTGTQSACQILKMLNFGDAVLVLDRSSLIRLLNPATQAVEKEILVKEKVIDIGIAAEHGVFYILTEERQVPAIYLKRSVPKGHGAFCIFWCENILMVPQIFNSGSGSSS